jgi:sigma-E factor negative regulatory protein RseC
MIEETGIVKSVDGMMARILIERKGPCDGCAVRGICQTTDEGMEIDALNPIQAKVGQTVKVSMKAQTYLKGTLLVYGMPLVVFIAGIIIGKDIGEKYFKSIDSDLISLLVGFSGFILSFLIVKLWSKTIETKKEYKPVIEEIVK